jgi:hypothetical protein
MWHYRDSAERSCVWKSVQVLAGQPDCDNRRNRRQRQYCQCHQTLIEVVERTIFSDDDGRQVVDVARQLVVQLADADFLPAFVILLLCLANNVADEPHSRNVGSPEWPRKNTPARDRSTPMVRVSRNKEATM